MRRLIIATLVALTLATGSRAAEPKPNIVLVLSDDHGWRDSGCYGNPDVRTPNMDRLATEGMRLTRAFAPAPLCTPSRAVISTGLMPFRNGAHYMGGSKMRPGIKTLPEYLKQQGYYTAFFGKPIESRKFDHEARWKSKEAAAFLRGYKSGKPLLLVVSLDWIPHTPWPANTTYKPAAFTLPPNFVDTPQTRADLANYYTGVTLADTILGDVMRAVDDAKLRDNTVLIYTSDQGANLPFAKWCVYDSGLRVPFLVRWPGKVDPRSVSDAMLSFSDLLPTFIEIAGGKPPAGLDGRSFLGVLTGNTAKHRDAIFGTHSGNANGGPGVANHCPARTVIVGQYQYILNLSPETTFTTHITGCMPGSPHYLAFWNSWVEKAKTDKFAAQIVNAYQHRPREEMYDLTADPYEMNNIVRDPKLAGVRRDLRRQLAAWCKQQGDIEPLKHLSP